MGPVAIVPYRPAEAVDSADPRVNLRFTACRDPGGMRLSRSGEMGRPWRAEWEGEDWWSGQADPQGERIRLFATTPARSK